MNITQAENNTGNQTHEKQKHVKENNLNQNYT